MYLTLCGFMWLKLWISFKIQGTKSSILKHTPVDDQIKTFEKFSSVQFSLRKLHSKAN
jgi:hypothetical protein